MKRLSILLILFLCGYLAMAQKQRLVVAQDGSGDYTTVQAAVDAVRSFPLERVEIYIRKGVYREKLVIPSWKTGITMRGEDRNRTIISWNDYSGKGDINTFTSYTMLVQADDFRAENLTIENNAGRVGQAVALHLEADRCVFSNCRLLGDQDTLYAGKGGNRQLFENCYIEGTTDFIFGPATVLFNNCTIHCKKNSYITAASTPQGQAYGFVFLNCSVTASKEATKVYLGRPWRPYAQTVFIKTKLGGHIRPEGWHNWNKPEAEQTTFYAEYKSRGPGDSPKTRVKWSQQLSKEEAGKYKADLVLSGSDGWEILGE